MFNREQNPIVSELFGSVNYPIGFKEKKLIINVVNSPLNVA